MANLEIVREVLKEELERVIHMQDLYLQEYENGPKGSVFIEKNKYVYLVQRIGKSVHKKYIGKVEELNIESIKIQIIENKKNKEYYKELLEDEKKLRKAIDCL